jgi:hypothetical protein
MHAVFLLALVMVVAAVATCAFVLSRKLANRSTAVPPSPSPSINAPSRLQPFPIAPASKLPTKVEVVASPLSWDSKDENAVVMRTVAAFEKFYHMGIRMTFPDESTMKTVVGKPSNVWAWNDYTNPTSLVQQTDWPRNWNSYRQLSFELFADDFASAPCPEVVAGKVKPGTATVYMVQVIPKWQLELEVGEISDVGALVKLRDKVLEYGSYTMAGLKREGVLLYSVYSSFNYKNGLPSALSNTCNTLVDDILRYLKLEKPPILGATRDAWDIIDDGAVETAFDDISATAYFADTAAKLKLIEEGKQKYILANPTDAWDTIQRILNPAYIVAYSDEERTTIKLYNISYLPSPVVGRAITN